MIEIVLHVRLTGGDHPDVTHEVRDAVTADDALERAIGTLAQDSGVLRSRRGDRLVVFYGRGVAAIEAAPRGAIL
jgi:hypothetical protein